MEQSLDLRWNNGLVRKLQVDMSKVGKKNTERTLEALGFLVNQ